MQVAYAAVSIYTFALAYLLCWRRWYSRTPAALFQVNKPTSSACNCVSWLGKVDRLSVHMEGCPCSVITFNINVYSIYDPKSPWNPIHWTFIYFLHVLCIYVVVLFHHKCIRTSSTMCSWCPFYFFYLCPLSLTACVHFAHCVSCSPELQVKLTSPP